MCSYYKHVVYEIMLIKKEVRKEKKRKENGKNMKTRFHWFLERNVKCLRKIKTMFMQIEYQLAKS